MPNIANVLDTMTNVRRLMPLPHGARVLEDGHVRLYDGQLLDWRGLRDWWRERGVFDHAAHEEGQS